MPNVPDHIIQRMQRLANVTADGGYHPNEVEFAAAKLSEELAKYQMTMADIQGSEIKDIREQVEQGDVTLKDERGHDKRWRISCCVYADCIGRAFDCKVLRSGAFNIKFIGLASDVKVAEFFFRSTWQPIVDAGAKKGRALGYKGAHLITFYDSFLIGAGQAIEKRLKERRETDAMMHDLRRGGSGDDAPSCDAGNLPAVVGPPTAALVPLKKLKVDAFMKQHYPRTTTTRSRAGNSHEGRERGYEHGESMSLDRPLEGRSAPRGQLRG